MERHNYRIAIRGGHIPSEYLSLNTDVNGYSDIVIANSEDALDFFNKIEPTAKILESLRPFSINKDINIIIVYFFKNEILISKKKMKKENINNWIVSYE